MIPTTSDAISFPKNDFTKKWDEVVVKGEVYRAYSHIDHLDNPDKDKLNVSVKITKEDYAALNKHRAFDGRKVSGLKKVEVKVKKLDEDGEPIKENGKFVFEEDDEGEPLTEFSHYQITFSMNPFKKDDEGDLVPRDLPIRVKKGIEFNLKDRIAEGSKVIVKGSLWDWTHKDQGDGCSLNLSSIAITELIKLETNAYDPFAGMDLEDEFEDIEVPTFTKPEAKADVPADKPAETTSQAPAIDDEEDPFADA